MSWLDKLKWWKKPEKVDPPDEYAIIKLTDIAKENGVYDDENKIIEITSHGKVQKIKYTEADAQALREQGTPVIDEEYSEDYEFVMGSDFGGVEYRR